MAETEETIDNQDEISEEEIEENLEESFPASDPPSWTLGHEPDGQHESETNN